MAEKLGLAEVSLPIKAPFPWFGGKALVAGLLWERFGNVPNYVEPFFGSGAVLLNRQDKPGIETVNDKDGFVANFWRAVQADPESTARWADWPVNENDLHARHVWLRTRRKELAPKLEGDPEFFDPKIAGWWVWGICCWIGGGWCDPNTTGPWAVRDGQLVHLGGAQGVKRQLVRLGDAGLGVNRKLVRLGTAGLGVNRKRRGQGLLDWFVALQDRLRHVRVCCGDWSRICGPTPTFKQGLTGVFLDPPYSAEAGRDEKIYAAEDLTVAHDIGKWALESGDNPLLRIALCGYEGEHDMPESWECVHWKTTGGYGSQGNARGRENSTRECVWFSPHCLRVTLDFDQPKRELAALSALRESGHPDKAGIELAIEDWIVEDAINEVEKGS